MGAIAAACGNVFRCSQDRVWYGQEHGIYSVTGAAGKCAREALCTSPTGRNRLAWSRD